MSAELARLPNALRTEAGFAALLGQDDAVVAVPDAAQPFVVAGLASLSAAPVVVIALPSATQAERLTHDLRAFLGEEAVCSFPAWETLPFERISPSVETMGTRLSVLARIAAHRRVGASSPLVVVAPIKALLQRLGEQTPFASRVLSQGDEIDVDGLIHWLVDSGYRREYQVEHRGEFAVRGGILDVFSSTGDGGIRIDCFGDVIERLTSFDVTSQRSIDDVALVELFACRELLITPELSARAALLAPKGFASDRFSRLAHGESFDGVESFLPWLTPEEHLLTDGLTPADRVVLIEPGRIRDRANELLDESRARGIARDNLGGK